MKERVSVVIPARWDSHRFPGKVLADINGRPLLWHVWERVSRMELVDEVVVAVDQARVFDAVESWGGRAVMTPRGCTSGTERIASIIDLLEGEFILNVQADECLVDSRMLDAMVREYRKISCDILTPVCRFTLMEDVLNPNNVKAIVGQDGSIIYFSRSPIPYCRDVDVKEWLSKSDYWWHLGVYGFSRKVLEGYDRMPRGKLEEVEKLEQLRFLEAGYRFRAIETMHPGPAVDTPGDLELAKAILMGSAQ